MHRRILSTPALLASAFGIFVAWNFANFFMNVRQEGQRSACYSNLKQLALAYAQYTQDCGGHSLAISIGSQGWGDSLFPYVKSWKTFQCPAAKSPVAQRRTDYFYNARLAAINKASSNGQIILFGDGYDNCGLNANLSELPFDWREDQNSPTRRHFSGSDYVFADGHVKFLRPERVLMLKPSRTDDNCVNTFLVGSEP